MKKLKETGKLLAQRDAFGDTLIELIDQDERVYVLDGDLANSTKADKVSQERPDRFLQMGIAEQNMMGVAAVISTERLGTTGFDAVGGGGWKAGCWGGCG